MTEYITNPEKRCIYCEGREVITLDEFGRPIERNLAWNDTMEAFICKDRKECSQNVEAEHTIISFRGDEEGIKERVVTKNGLLVSEVKSEEPMEDWFKW